LLQRNFILGFFQEWRYTVNQPETLAFAREIRDLINSYQPERFLLGEIFASDEIKREYLGQDQGGLNLVFLWDLPDARVTANNLRNVIEKYEAKYPDPYLPVYVLGNHDRKRIVSRVRGNVNLAKLLAVLIFTARGIPVTYYGEEIGMLEGDRPIKACLDPVGQRYKNVPAVLLDALDLYVNRDGCRTPMQWNPGKNAGFSATNGNLWLALSSNYMEQNVEELARNSDSILNLYKDLLLLRKNSAALIKGSLKMLDQPADILAYEREIPEEKIGVFLNFSDRANRVELDAPVDRVIHSIHSIEIKSGKINLPPYGSAVIRYK